jgi:hypothetical protein
MSSLQIPKLFLRGQEGKHIQQSKGETKESTTRDAVITISADCAGADVKIGKQKAAAPGICTGEQGDQRNTSEHTDDGITFAWEELDSRNDRAE